jgi:hypothetical protein
LANASGNFAAFMVISLNLLPLNTSLSTGRMEEETSPMAIDLARRGGCGMTVIVLFARNSHTQIT